MSPYDVIVIGGGHNGLTAAAWLAKQGHKVCVVERRATLGGAAATEELFPGFHFNTGSPSVLSTHVVDALKLQDHGLEFIESAVLAFAPQANGGAVTLWRDAERTEPELAAFSPRDALVFGKFAKQNETFARILVDMAALQPPNLKNNSLRLLAGWTRLALKARALGGRDMMELLRVLPMSAYQYLNEYFESDALKGLLASFCMTGLMQGPRASGTNYMLLYQQIGGQNRAATIRGGVGQLGAALAQAAQSHGALIRTGIAVTRIVTDKDRVIGVEIEGGEQIRAKTILSNADPRTTFLGLLGAPNLEPRIMRRLRSLKLRGSTASLHLALSGLPEFPSANGDADRLKNAIVICPTLDYAERAYDDAKHGQMSAQPILHAYLPSLQDPTLAPAGQHSMSIIFRYAPYRLHKGNWDSEREHLGDLAIETLAPYAPNLKALVLNRRVITPLDYERNYGLAEGSEMHGQMGLDQLLTMRPVPGFVGYRSPVDGLYLCGAGAHPGGGLTGFPGLNAARQAHREIG